MLQLPTLKIAICTSSSFVIPIIQDILSNSDSTLGEIYDKQLINSNILDQKNTVIFGNEIDNVQNNKNNNSKVEFKNSSQDNSKNILQNYYNTKVELVLIITQPDRINRDKVIQNPIKKWCLENQSQNKIKVLSPDKIKEVQAELEQIDIVITASFGQIIDRETLIKPKLGWLNWHPSLLPKYRGATPMQSAIVNQDQYLGLSWIDVGIKMDEGEVYYQSKTLNSNQIYQDQILHQAHIGSSTWAIAIINKLQGNSISQEELSSINNQKLSFCGRLTKEDSSTDNHSKTAKEIIAKFLAYNEFPGTVIPKDEVFGEFRIIEIIKTQEEFLNIKEESIKENIIFESINWLIIKENKQQKCYLKCKNNEYLQITKIKNSFGKMIGLEGFDFGKLENKLK